MTTRTPLREAAAAPGPPPARTQQRGLAVLLILATAAYITGLYANDLRVPLWWLAAALLLGWLLAVRPSARRRDSRTAPRTTGRWQGRVLAALAGGLPVLSLPSVGWWWFAWISLVPLLLLLHDAATQREAGVRGWWGGAGFVLATEYWLFPVAGPGLLVLAFGLGLLWLPWGRAARRLLNDAPLAAVVVLPAGWIAIETVRSWQSLGGPWALLGTTQAANPDQLGSAALGGVWLTGLLVVLVNTAVTALVLGGGRPRLLLAAAAIAALAVGPVWDAVRPALPTQGAYRVAVVQPGVMNGASARLAREIQLTRSMAAQHPNLVVWGESSVGVDLATRPDITGQLVALTHEVGADVLLNVDARRTDGSIEKTSALITPRGSDGSYTKTRLVPFGEYIPLRQELGWLSVVSKAAKQNRGRGSGPVLLSADGRSVGPLICFESTFPDMSRREVQLGAHVIVYQTATTTFQGSWAQPQQAMASAVRAAETGRPVVHVALTGVSAAFDATGHRQLWLPAGQRNATVVTLQLTSGRTPFDVAGDWVLACCAVILALALLRGAGAIRPCFRRDP